MTASSDWVKPKIVRIKYKDDEWFIKKADLILLPKK